MSNIKYPESDNNALQLCESCGAPEASWWAVMSAWLCNFCGRN